MIRIKVVHFVAMDQRLMVWYEQDLMWTDARDMWYLAVDSCWAEFLLQPRPLPLIDALPLAAWLYAKPKGKHAC